MTNEEKLEQENIWLDRHNVDKPGDLVYDGMGVVTMIDKGQFDYEIRIMPVYINHNLGNGYGMMITIKF
jgi:hypothetical protein